jgi:pimeloyl-ACP methyl ester carboxylesterase
LIVNCDDFGMHDAVDAASISRSFGTPPSTGRRCAQLLRHAVLGVYEDAPHGLYITNKGRLNKDLIDFATCS